MKAGVMGAGDLLRMVRTGVDVNSIRAQSRRPFRIYLCGDPALIAEMRSLLLRAPADEETPDDAALTLETIVPGRPTPLAEEAKAVIFLGRPGDREGADTASLTALKLPVLAITVDPSASAPAGAASAPEPGSIADYVVPALDAPSLRHHGFPHLAHACNGVEVAVARRFPVLREHCAAKLTRDCAKRALTIAAASAVVDHVPFVGLVLGPFTSAGDMLAITGLQMALFMQVGSCYGKEPDLQRVWELLPVVGGGFGWRALSRELAGFIPVAGIAIKGAIAYAGTIVVGEGANFYYEHGRHMSAADGAKLYEETKASAISLARDIFNRIKRKG